MIRKPPYILFLILALLALLPLLAVLQYYWLGEVSKGERERMKSNLQVSAAQFGQEFDREVKNAYLHFQTGAAPFSNQTNSEFADLYRRWQTTSAHPGFVKEVYQVEIGENGTYRLFLFNPSTGIFQYCRWPEKLEGLRLSIERHRKAQDTAQSILRNVLKQGTETIRDHTFVTPIVKFSIEQVDGGIPGLIIPILMTPYRVESGNFAMPALHAYRIVAFDLDYIKTEFITELAKRHFANDGQSDYNFAIIKRDDPKVVIFKSAGGWPQNGPVSGDVTNSFFNAPISDGDRMLIAGKLRERGDKEREDKVFKSGPRHFALSIFQNRKTILRKEEGTKPEANAGANLQSRDDGLWQLVVQHRTGSLETAVAGARRRNLAVSFGILILLGVSVALIILSSRRAQRLAKQQMEFVAGVSHELRTPLAVICSAAENLADGVIDNRDQIKLYGGLIRDEGRRLTQMVEQVLDFSGDQSGRTYVLQQTQLDRVIDHALAACHLQIVDGGFKIEKKIAEQLPMVNIDPAALSRAIQNLLGNAMKYSGESRWLGLSVESLGTKQREAVEIKISDHGLGIGPHELPHIFEPFFRGKEAIDSQIHGNGLGLSLVKQIIETHGGRITVESKLKHGTTFTLRLPVTPDESLSNESTKEDYGQAHFAR